MVRPILFPRSNDVLLGKGAAIIKHPGNVRMRSILDSYHATYEAIGKKDKTQLCWEIWHSLRSTGVRFLREDPDYGWWVEADDETAQKKVSVGLRDLASKKKSQAAQQHSNSATSAYSNLDGQNCTGMAGASGNRPCCSSF